MSTKLATQVITNNFSIMIFSGDTRAWRHLRGPGSSAVSRILMHRRIKHIWYVHIQPNECASLLCWMFSVLPTVNIWKAKTFKQLAILEFFVVKWQEWWPQTNVPKRPCLILKVLNPGKIFHVARNPFVVYYLQGIYVHSSLTPDPKNTVKTVILLYENITSISLQWKSGFDWSHGRSFKGRSWHQYESVLFGKRHQGFGRTKWRKKHSSTLSRVRFDQIVTKRSWREQ